MELKARGLPTSGNKTHLINQLQKALEDPIQPAFEDAIRIQAGEFDSDNGGGDGGAEVWKTEGFW